MAAGTGKRDVPGPSSHDVHRWTQVLRRTAIYLWAERIWHSAIKSA